MKTLLIAIAMLRYYHPRYVLRNAKLVVQTAKDRGISLSYARIVQTIWRGYGAEFSRR